MNRALHLAIAASLALHGVLLLFGGPVDRKAAKPQPPPLEARLVEPPAPPPALPPAPKAKPEKPPPPPPAPPVKPKPRPKPSPVARPAPVAKPAPEAPPAPPEVLPQPEPAPPSVARIEPRPAPPPPPGPSAEEIEAATREQYRLALIDAARRHNRYPRLARENNWEGEVRVRMVIGGDGAASLSIQGSSGHPVLDRQALEMFKRAQAHVPLPAALRGKSFSLELRAIYNLKDQGSG